MERVTYRPVRFAGQSTGSGPATCGQASMWLDITDKDPREAFFNPSGEVETPAGLTVDDLLAELGALVGRHESLRTFLAEDAGGGLSQTVTGSGEFPVCLIDLGDAPESLWEELAERRKVVERLPFDLSAELPIRPTIFHGSGEPLAVLLSVAHTAADGGGVRNLVADLAAMAQARAKGLDRPPPPPARQPLEQARYEASAEGRRRLAGALNFWETSLATVPRTMFPTAPKPGPPAYHAAVLHSRAADLALNLQALRYDVSGTAVLLAATGLVLGAYTGMPTCAVRLICANRTSEPERRAVACMIQGVLVSLGLGGTGFGDVVARAWPASVRAYRHGLYDRREVRRITRAAEQRRGVRLDLSCVFNEMREETRPDHRLAAHRATRPQAADEAAVRAAMRDSVFRPEPAVEQETFALYAEDTPETLRLTLHADARHLDPDAVRAVLFGIERLLVESAFGEVRPEEVGALTGLAAPPREGRWLWHEGCWTDLDAVERMLGEVLDVRAARVETESGEDGKPRIAAHLWPARERLTADDAHAACMAALPGRQTAVAPHRYVIHPVTGTGEPG
ncbi:condensation domain-containing protein [Nonomuraea muscovyensis]|uniref:condensation domain-containing protein n=1 Tax=Nonomuraea muscovyensis TaxID=1124761 RepID=UPI0033D174AB